MQIEGFSAMISEGILAQHPGGVHTGRTRVGERTGVPVIGSQVASETGARSYAHTALIAR